MMKLCGAALAAIVLSAIPSSIAASAATTEAMCLQTSDGAYWSFAATQGPGGTNILRNGVAAGGSGTELVLYNNVIFALSNVNAWWAYVNGGWEGSNKPASTAVSETPAVPCSTTPPPPAAPVINNGAVNTNDSVTLTGTAPDAATVTVSDAAGVLGTSTASATGAWTFTSPVLTSGVYTFTATDTTSAGTSAISNTFNETISAATPPPPTTCTGMQPAPSPYVPFGYCTIFDDEFQSGSTINPGPCCAAPGTNWFNGDEYCCMTPSDGGATSLYPATPNPGPPDPVNNGLTLTLNQSGATPTWYSTVLTSEDSAGNGFSFQSPITSGLGVYIEIQTQLPVGPNSPGTWPALWLLNKSNLPQPNPQPAEIDIMESYGQQAAPFWPGFCTSYHDWANLTGANFSQCGVLNGGGAAENLYSAPHVFGFLWTPTSCVVTLDGVVENETTICDQPVYAQAFYLLLDLGIGGGWPTTSTPKTNAMLVSHVRVYAQQAN